MDDETLCPFKLRLEEREGRGKCLVATEGFKKGAEFLEEAPLVYWRIVGNPAEDDSEAEAADILMAESAQNPLLVDLPRWLKWQALKSPMATVSLESLGSCMAYIAQSFQHFMKQGMGAQCALASALRPFDDLQGVPDDVEFEFHNTTPREMLTELHRGHLPSLMESISPVLLQLLTPHLVENICGRLALNSIRLPTDPVPMVGLFLILSNMNHDCKANVEIRQAEGTGNEVSVTLVAKRDIEPDEELCISYCPSDVTELSQRRAWLKHWCFTCECALCVREELEAETNKKSSCPSYDLTDGEDGKISSPDTISRSSPSAASSSSFFSPDRNRQSPSAPETISEDEDEHAEEAEPGAVAIDEEADPVVPDPDYYGEDNGENQNEHEEELDEYSIPRAPINVKRRRLRRRDNT